MGLFRKKINKSKKMIFDINDTVKEIEKELKKVEKIIAFCQK
jgi:hypothetical protein